MNRILKFRVWDKKFKKIITNENNESEEFFLHFNGIRAIRALDGYDGMKVVWETDWDERYIVSQFTNILDKNNKEIFEGDIVKFDISGIPHGPERENGIIGNVFFDIGLGCWCFGKDGYTFFDRIDKKTLEVIGNVFENKE